MAAGTWAALAVVALRGLLGWLLPARVFRRVGPLVQGGLVSRLLGWAVLMPQFLMAARSIWRDGGWTRDAVAAVLVRRGCTGTAIGEARTRPGTRWPVTRSRLALARPRPSSILVFLAWPARRQFAGGSVVYGGTNAPSTASRVIGARAALAPAAARRSSAHASSSRCSASAAARAPAVSRGGRRRQASRGRWAASSGQPRRQGAAAVTRPSMATLQIQFVLALLLVVAVRFAVTVPIALPANWLFRITERRGRRAITRARGGLRWRSACVPVVALVPAHGLHVGLVRRRVPRARRRVLRRLHRRTPVQLQAKVPFAAPYVSGSIRLKTRWLLYLSAGSVLTSLPAGLEERALQTPAAWPGCCRRASSASPAS